MSTQQQTTTSGAVTISYRMPDMSTRGTRATYLRAVDKGLKQWRQKFLHRHFLAAAFHLYPTEYAHLGKKTAKPAGAKKKPRDEITVSDEHVERREMTKLKVLDPKNARPLFHTGRSRSVALGNPATMTGKPGNRRLVVRGFPYYIKYVPNSYRAMSAVNPQETLAIRQVIDAALEQEYRT